MGIAQVTQSNVWSKVIVIDQELNLINIVEKVFSYAKHLLCRWHKGKKLLETSVLKNLTASWSELVFSTIKDKYNQHLIEIQKEYYDYHNLTEWVTTTWLNITKKSLCLLGQITQCILEIVNAKI